MSLELFWKVKPKRFVRDRRGVIVGNPGDMLAYTDKHALACPSSVVATWGEEEPAKPVHVEERTEDAATARYEDEAIKDASEDDIADAFEPEE